MSTFASAVNLSGRDTVREWGEQLKREHRPTNPLELPYFIKPKVAVPTTSPLPPKPAAGNAVRTETPKQSQPSPANMQHERPAHTRRSSARPAGSPTCSRRSKISAVPLTGDADGPDFIAAQTIISPSLRAPGYSGHFFDDRICFPWQLVGG